MLVNYGDFVLGNPNNQNDPFLQLLSTTNPATAHKQFVQSRLGGNNITISQTSPGTSSAGNFDSDGDDSQSSPTGTQSFLQKNWIFFVIAGGVLAAIIVSGCVWSSLRARRRNMYSKKDFIGGSMVATGPYKLLAKPSAVNTNVGYSDDQRIPELTQPYHASGYGDGGRGYVNPYA
ncbi:hypothetical protein M422DRAFT_277314 [Sphaerobolus stellatus SS14]|uniref:Uncharacterized protein n=1 Tax=Sphaerobolus stellatus (strain SS14) TaxID=990650 RepID=A0A0C9TKD1_SPHS4|nr:hypothetical protein M422DRAFT_277314 [Sphaerobolus stellatus SS14]